MGDRRTVLVAVEDEQRRGELAAALGSTGWQVVAAADAREATLRLADSSPQVVVLGLENPVATVSDILHPNGGAPRARRPAFLLLGRHTLPAVVAAAADSSAALFTARTDATPPAGRR